ncbi:MAG: hypothetical protein ABWZ91_11920 [Nocardioides sp.]|jgi:hypothetical protein
MAVGIVTGIPVADDNVALEWYKRLLGSEPTLHPSDVQEVWLPADDCHVDIVQPAAVRTPVSSVLR